MFQVSKQSFWGGFCSERNTFWSSAGARAREVGFFFIIVFYLPIRFQRGIPHPHTPTYREKPPGDEVLYWKKRVIAYDRL